MKMVVLPGLDGTGRLSAHFADAMSETSDVTVVTYPDDLTSYKDITEWLQTRLPDEDFVLVAPSFS